MLALQRARPGEAADLFGRVYRSAGWRAAPERADLLWSARYHEALSLHRDGREEPARVALAEVAAAGGPLADSARALLEAAEG